MPPGRPRRPQRSTVSPCSPHHRGRRWSRPSWPLPGQPLLDFLQSWSLGCPADLANQVVGQRHPLQCRPRLEMTMQLRRHVPDLDRHRHALAVVSSNSHVKRRLGSPMESPASDLFARCLRRFLPSRCAKVCRSFQPVPRPTHKKSGQPKLPAQCQRGFTG